MLLRLYLDLGQTNIEKKKQKEMDLISRLRPSRLFYLQYLGNGKKRLKEEEGYEPEQRASQKDISLE